MLRVVADTNIYISALNFGGVPERVLALARRGRLDLFISKPILDEIEGVLKRKFQWPASRVREAASTIREFAKIVEPRERIAIVRNDEPDNRVLECAVAAKARIIVSGDSHLRDLRSFRGMRILSPRTLLDTLGE